MSLNKIAATVKRDRNATIIGDRKTLGIIRVDPHTVIVHMHLQCCRTTRLATVVRHLHLRAGEIHPIRVLRIHAHLRVIERAHIDIVLLRPRLTGIARAIKPVQLWRRLRLVTSVLRRIGCLDHRVHHIRIAERNRDAHTPLGRAGNSAPDNLGPRLATIHALPHRRTGAATLERVWRAQPFPARRPNDFRIARVQCDVHKTGFIADELDQLPRLAAVSGLVQPAFRIRLPRRAERCDVYSIWVARMHHDAADVLRLLKPHQRPMQSAVGGLINAATWLNRIARVRFARARPHLIRVTRRDSQHPHRNHAFVIKYRPPGHTVVHRFPNSAAGSGHKPGLGRTGDADHVG